VQFFGWRQLFLKFQQVKNFRDELDAHTIHVRCTC
jgi:hypothetical protein